MAARTDAALALVPPPRCGRGRRDRGRDGVDRWCGGVRDDVALQRRDADDGHTLRHHGHPRRHAHQREPCLRRRDRAQPGGAAAAGGAAVARARARVDLRPHPLRGRGHVEQHLTFRRSPAERRGVADPRLVA